MLQAQIDENGIVVNINNWEHEVGIPCTEFTQIGEQWNGTEFVESTDSIIARYDARLLNHFNEIAQSKKYDSWITCSLRAGMTGSAYQAEGKAFADWMESCNVKAYQIMQDVLSGQMALPTEDEFIALLPVITWGN